MRAGPSTLDPISESRSDESRESHEPGEPRSLAFEAVRVAVRCRGARQDEHGRPAHHPHLPAEADLSSAPQCPGNFLGGSLSMESHPARSVVLNLGHEACDVIVARREEAVAACGPGLRDVLNPSPNRRISASRLDRATRASAPRHAGAPESLPAPAYMPDRGRPLPASIPQIQRAGSCR